MKKLYIFIMILTLGVFLSGCTPNEEETDDTNSLDNVTVVGDEEEEDVEEETEEDEPEVTEPEEEEEDQEEPEEEEDEEEPTTVLEDGTKTVGTATSADGASVLAYSYGVVGGKMEFSWKVRGSTDKPYPKATAKLMSDNSIVVEFESLSKDYVATSDGGFDLGSHLPDLAWTKTTNGSKYTFKFDAKKTFDLTAQEIEGETGLFVVLKVTL